VVVPEIGVRVPSTLLIRRLVEAPNQSSIVVPLNWVLDCLAQEQLLDVETYILRSPADTDNEPSQDSVAQSDPSYQISEELGDLVEHTNPILNTEPLHERSVDHDHFSGANFCSPDLASITTSQKHLLDVLNPPLIPLSIAMSEAGPSQAQPCDLQHLDNNLPKQVAVSPICEANHASPSVGPDIATTLNSVMDVPSSTVSEIKWGSVELGDQPGSSKLGSDPDPSFPNGEGQWVSTL
jgi:hypothetical protein